MHPLPVIIQNQPTDLFVVCAGLLKLETVRPRIHCPEKPCLRKSYRSELMTLPAYCVETCLLCALGTMP